MLIQLRFKHVLLLDVLYFGYVRGTVYKRYYAVERLGVEINSSCAKLVEKLTDYFRYNHLIGISRLEKWRTMKKSS